MRSLFFNSLLSLCFLTISLSGGAQDIKLNTAIDKLGDAKQKDPGKAQRRNLKRALNSIEVAKDHEETKNRPQTWFTRARIMAMIAKAQDSATKALVDDALQKALHSIEKVKELGGEEDFKRQMPALKGDLSVPAFQEASKAFEEGNYQKAYELFKMAGESRAGLMMGHAQRKMKRNDDIDNIREAFESLEKIDTTAFDALYYAAIAAENVGKKDSSKQEEMDSIAFRYYRQVIGTGFQEGKAIIRATDVLQRQGKEEAMLELLDQGIEQYPENTELIRKRAQYHLEKGDIEKAKKSVKKAAEKQEDDRNLKLILAGIYKSLSKKMREKDSTESAKRYFDLAAKNYSESISKDSTGQSDQLALRGYGLLYYNEAAKLYQGGGQEEQKKAKELWRKEAEPTLEKAFELDHDDETVSRALLKIYSRLGKPEEYKAVKKKGGYE